MLEQVEDCVAVVICNTCRVSKDARADADGIRGGAKLADAIAKVKSSDPRYDAIAVQEMPCLFACGDFCTVHLRGPDKVGYVMGRFTPNEDAARAILDYAVHYAESDYGRVAFRDWPEGVKGHFITRTPPAGFVVSE